jgi:hypothetical protein
MSLNNEGVLCSVNAKSSGEQLIGTAPQISSFLLIEVAPPWDPAILESEKFPKGIKRMLDNIPNAPYIVGLIPDASYTPNGFTKILRFTKPMGLFTRYEKSSYLLPNLALDNINNLEDLQEYEETDVSRELLVCTHSTHDRCCGIFGTQLYSLLRQQANNMKGTHIWRTSHLNGHRFAPTVVDFPDGRYWGSLNRESALHLINRDESASLLASNHRGLAGLHNFEQLADHQMFMERGWPWLDYPKYFEITAPENYPSDPIYDPETIDQASVAIHFLENDTPQEYQVTIEPSGNIKTKTDCNGTLMNIKNYRVRQLRK